MGKHTPDNTDAAAQEADDRITEEGTQVITPFEIFGTSTCEYCEKAKELLTAQGQKFVFKNIDEDEEAFDQLVGRIKSWKTVPQIFYGPTYIGGYKELQNVRAAWVNPVSGSAGEEEGEAVAWPVVTDQWAETYCELTGKDPDGQQVTFVDGGTVATFRDMARREIEAMLCAAPKATVRAIAALQQEGE